MKESQSFDRPITNIQSQLITLPISEIVLNFVTNPRIYGVWSASFSISNLEEIGKLLKADYK